MFLSRKINPAKWKKIEGLQPGETPADAVTSDLITKSNTLSFWRCDSFSKDHESVKAVALALATGSRVERFELLRLVFIPVADLEAEGQTLKDTSGDTAVQSLTGLHVDISRLDAFRLAKLANSVAYAAQSLRCCRFMKSEVKTLVLNAFQGNQLDVSKLDPKLLMEINEALPDSNVPGFC